MLLEAAASCVNPYMSPVKKNERAAGIAST
jgi:hypothetical protein